MTKKQQQLINIASLVAAPFTGGLSLLGLLAPYVLGGDDNGLNQNLEIWKIQNEQYKIQTAANQAEVERLRKEREDLEQKQKHNNDEIARINSIINNPNSTEEERTNAKKRLVLLETDNKKLRKALDDLENIIKVKINNPPAPPSRPLGSYLPNLKFMDKIILAGGITLLVYLVIIKDDKKK